MKLKLEIQIKRYIRSQRTNAYQLALRAGVSPASISRFLSGKRSISYETAKKIISVIEKANRIRNKNKRASVSIKKPETQKLNR